jgi:hypothetical protein
MPAAPHPIGGSFKKEVISEKVKLSGEEKRSEPFSERRPLR